jgi:CBS domain containing-hemolysin-like protein
MFEPNERGGAAASSLIAVRSEAQLMLEQMRETSQRLQVVLRELDDVMGNIKHSPSQQAGNTAVGSPPVTKPAATLFEGLEMLQRENQQVADKLEQRVKELSSWF